jgi:hypothetical protein
MARQYNAEARQYTMMARQCNTMAKAVQCEANCYSTFAPLALINYILTATLHHISAAAKHNMR